MLRGARCVTQRDAAIMCQTHRLTAQLVTTDLVSSIPTLRRDIGPVTNPGDDASAASLRQIAISVAGIQRLAAKEETIGVQREELVHT